MEAGPPEGDVREQNPECRWDPDWVAVACGAGWRRSRTALSGRDAREAERRRNAGRAQGWGTAGAGWAAAARGMGPTAYGMRSGNGSARREPAARTPGGGGGGGGAGGHGEDEARWWGRAERGKK